MLDSGTLDVLNSIRNSRWLFEDSSTASNTKSLKSGDEAYDDFYSSLSEQLTDVPISIEYFTFTRPDGGQQPIIEVSGNLQGTFNFIYKYGLDDGVFINVENFKMKSSTPEAIRILYVFYDTNFQQLCKTLVET